MLSPLARPETNAADLRAPTRREGRNEDLLQLPPEEAIGAELTHSRDKLAQTREPEAEAMAPTSLTEAGSALMERRMNQDSQPQNGKPRNPANNRLMRQSEERSGRKDDALCNQ